MGSSSSTCISHPAHSKHKLMLERPEKQKFNCDGCHQKGKGERYRCHACNFNLHKQCALREGTKIVHPSLKNIKIKFRFQVPSSEGTWWLCLSHCLALQSVNTDRLVCDACRGTVRGFHYHCNKLCFHPCCVYPTEENDDGADGQIMDICKKMAPIVLNIIIAAATG